MKTLVVTDVQYDFYDPEGSLYVKGAEKLPSLIAEAVAEYDFLVFTLDCHPANHCSFSENGGIWPSHCVAYTEGCGLSSKLIPVLKAFGDNVRYYFKGRDPQKEQYAAFEDIDEGNDPKGILEVLNRSSRVDICGIAGDYCVLETLKQLVRLIGPEKINVRKDLIASIGDGKVLDDYILSLGIDCTE